MQRPSRYERNKVREKEYKKDITVNGMVLQLVFCVLIFLFVYTLKSSQNFLYLDIKNILLQEFSKESSVSVEEITKDVWNTYVDGKDDDMGEAIMVMSGKGGYNPIDIEQDGILQAPEYASFAPVRISSDMILPVTRGRLTSPFGYRYHPISEEIDFHRGVDIGAEGGSPVLASYFGTVTEVGNSDIYGNYIEITHSDNLKTVYSHCQDIIAKVGMKVKKGDRIATIGTTGISTGYHVHFEIIVDGKYVDPAWIFEEIKM